MTWIDAHDLPAILRHVRELTATEQLRVTQHVQQEMVEDDTTLDDVLAAIQSGEMLENYPEHRRGACCLIGGYTEQQRPLHVVCTTVNPVLILITVYEPKPPKWVTPTEQGQRP